MNTNPLEPNRLKRKYWCNFRPPYTLVITEAQHYGAISEQPIEEWSLRRLTDFLFELLRGGARQVHTLLFHGCYDQEQVSSRRVSHTPFNLSSPNYRSSHPETYVFLIFERND